MNLRESLSRSRVSFSFDDGSLRNPGFFDARNVYFFRRILPCERYYSIKRPYFDFRLLNALPCRHPSRRNPSFWGFQRQMRFRGQFATAYKVLACIVVPCEGDFGILKIRPWRCISLDDTFICANTSDQ